MQKKPVKFSSAIVDYYFDAKLAELNKIVDRSNTVLVTDENVFSLHQNKFKNWNTIVLKPGETYKVQPTVDSVIQQLIDLNADRTTTLVGIGGGVVTDITGYAACIYMRGLNFGFVPTTILALVDASIGGKNGVDAGVYKNMVGLIKQPAFILHDLSLLKTLPHPEWRNGFAEIIKHACIKDAAMFGELESADLNFFQKKLPDLSQLIINNALLKSKIVQKDELERGDRKLLNFGHTIGHAVENLYSIPHGEAVSIGMSYAAGISANELKFKEATRITNLLKQYELPTEFRFEKEKVFEILKKDKKKIKDSIDYILLKQIGKAVIQRFSFNKLKQYL